MKNLIKLCTVMVFISSSIIGFAQRNSTNNAHGYRVETPEGVKYFDSENDWNVWKRFNEHKTGWIYGTGEATGDLNETTETELRREAQDAAIDQVAGQLARRISKIHKDMRTKGKRAGRTRDDAILQDGMMYQIKAELPEVTEQYCYKINKHGNTVTYVVGVGIDKESQRRIEADLQTEDDYKKSETELDNFFN